jgi:peptide deformylase
MRATIITIGDDRLRQKSEKIDPVEAYDLIETLFETLAGTTGVGLAAPQIGVMKKVFVTDYDDNPLFFINPTIIETSQETIDLFEGCLSVPYKDNMLKGITRAKSVIVHSVDLKGKPVITKAGGMLARIIQHEMDHLNGILYVDRL